jgi:hypothetical protein
MEPQSPVECLKEQLTASIELVLSRTNSTR